LARQIPDNVRTKSRELCLGRNRAPSVLGTEGAVDGSEKGNCSRETKPTSVLVRPKE